MNSFAVFGLQTGFALGAYAILARWYLWPWLTQRPAHFVLTILLWLHVSRIVGSTILADAVSDPALPRGFANSVAFGDLAAALLALAALAALHYRWTTALPLVWIFTVVGVADLVNAAVQGIAVGATDYRLGATWFIPTFLVPALWVSHVLIVLLLLRDRREQRVASLDASAPTT